jgi:hypothetical protein
MACRQPSPRLDGRPSPTTAHLRTSRRKVTIKELQTAVKFLRRLVVGQTEVDTLINTIHALEAEIERRKRK